MRLMFEFWSANPIWMPKKPNEMFHKPAKDCRGFSMTGMISPPGSDDARIWREAGRRAGNAQPHCIRMHGQL